MRPGRHQQVHAHRVARRSHDPRSGLYHPDFQRRIEHLRDSWIFSSGDGHRVCGRPVHLDGPHCDPSGRGRHKWLVRVQSHGAYSRDHLCGHHPIPWPDRGHPVGGNQLRRPQNGLQRRGGSLPGTSFHRTERHPVPSRQGAQLLRIHHRVCQRYRSSHHRHDPFELTCGRPGAHQFPDLEEVLGNQLRGAHELGPHPALRRSLRRDRDSPFGRSFQSCHHDLRWTSHGGNLDQRAATHHHRHLGRIHLDHRFQRHCAHLHHLSGRGRRGGIGTGRCRQTHRRSLLPDPTQHAR